MDGHDTARGQALGARGAHVVGAQVLDQARARQTRDGGQREGAQHETGQEEAQPGVLGVVADLEHLAQPLRRPLALAEREADLEADEQQGERAGDEDRDGDEHRGGDTHQVVDELVLAEARQDADEDADDDLERQRDELHAQRDADALEEELAHGTAAVVGAEVALGVLAQPLDEETDARVSGLLQTRVVQAVLDLELLDDLRGRGVLAEQRPHRVAHDLDRDGGEDVKQEQRPQDDGDELDESAGYVAPHVRPFRSLNARNP